MRGLELIAANVTLCFVASLPISAQIVPDTTLPNNSQVEVIGKEQIITEGTQAGGNLFHSFEGFSLPTGNTAYFNSAQNLQNIFSRITGGSISNIDGIIRANDTANLFLINPNGMIFGPNARLNIGGSFVGTTASSINFADGIKFSAKAAQNTPLLTISVPIGLNFSGNPSSIRVRNVGHNLGGIGNVPVSRNNSSNTSLSVKPGKTLALVGGEIDLEGGLLTTAGGRIELGSVENGSAALDLTNSQLSVQYQNAANFRDIQLSKRSSLDVSGIPSGSIHLQGKRITLSNGSVILSQNQGRQPSGNISVTASDSVEISGTDPEAKILGSLWNETLGLGDGGEIVVTTPRLVLQAGGTITTRTYGNAKAGDIILNATESLQVIGGSPITPRAVSNISSFTFSSGQSGDLKVSTKDLIAAGGGILSSTTSGSGKGGDITIDATDSVQMNGVKPNLFLPSAVTASTVGTGEAGKLTINTSRLIVKNGGRIDSSTIAAGAAGSVNIHAQDAVEVSGVVPGSRNPSLVISSANTLDETLVQAFGTPPQLTGASGDVTINTQKLSVIDGGLVNVRNDGSGNAGQIQVNARSINLNDNGGITAATAAGEGGNISLRSENLQLGNSAITASAGGNSNGGNIKIDTSILTTTGSSSIVANAIRGNGGRVSINTQGFFRSPDTAIAASSQLGINGTVQINTLLVNPSPDLTQPEVIRSTPEIASVCQGRSNAAASEYVITGTGGIPSSPDDLLSSNGGWHDNSVVPIADEDLGEPNSSIPREPTQLVEAQGWRQNPDGTIILTAEPNTAIPDSSASTVSCRLQPVTRESLPSENRARQHE